MQLVRKKHYLCELHMKISRIIILILPIVVAVLAGCRRLSQTDDSQLLARVGGDKLYLSEVGSLFTPGITEQDSLRVLESYVDMWVKKQLKVAQAEKMFRGSNDEIDRMVEEYRNSLLSHKIDQYRIDSGADTIYDDSAIAEYYDSHRGDFVLDRPLVKGVIVKFPAAFRQRSQLDDMMRGEGEEYQNFLDISAKNGFELHEFDSWTDLSDFVAPAPASMMSESVEMQIMAGNVVEMIEGTYIYLIYARNALKPGQTAPLEKVSDIIRRILINQGRQEAIRSYEDSLYNAAVADDRVKIYVQ